LADIVIWRHPVLPAGTYTDMFDITKISCVFVDL
jgi:hypothetical protein